MAGKDGKLVLMGVYKQHFKNKIRLYLMNSRKFLNLRYTITRNVEAVEMQINP